MLIDVTIEGTNAMLQHAYRVATTANPGARETKLRDSQNYSEEWVKATYTNKEGFVVMPAQNILACLFDGSKGMKVGKKALTRVVNTSLSILPREPLVEIDGKKITIDDIRENDWIYMCGAVISQRRVDRTRTMLPVGWTISFQIKGRDTLMSGEDIKAVVESAGMNAGLGDWRPSSPRKPGPFGTFSIVGWEVGK